MELKDKLVSSFMAFEDRIDIDSPVHDIRSEAIKAFEAIDGSGLSRVDFFVNRDSHEIFINEVNTMPGFTPISMYSKLWQASGIEYAQLIDELISLAIDKQVQKERLSTSA
mgnify:CR=1 FL=1